MPPKFPDAIRNMPDFKEMRAMGIALAAKKVFEKDYEEANSVLKKIMDAWNTQIVDKYGKKLDEMKTREKIKIFNKIKVFT